jgi:hypothetical protein
MIERNDYGRVAYRAFVAACGGGDSCRAFDEACGGGDSNGDLLSTFPESTAKRDLCWSASKFEKTNHNHER